jgi:hypothetical protein
MGILLGPAFVRRADTRTIAVPDETAMKAG